MTADDRNDVLDCEREELTSGRRCIWFFGIVTFAAISMALASAVGGDYFGAKWLAAISAFFAFLVVMFIRCYRDEKRLYELALVSDDDLERLRVHQKYVAEFRKRLAEEPD